MSRSCFPIARRRRGAPGSLSLFTRVRRAVRSGPLAWLIVGLLALPGLAAAEGSATEKAAAESLFDQGLSLMKTGQYTQACEKLERSYAVESGIGTLLYLAECYAKVGRTASAWASFREAASAAQAQGQAARAAAGAARADELEPLLARLTIAVAPETQALAGLTVSYDSSVLGRGVWDTEFPVDPGDHVLSASAPGYQTWSGTVTIAGASTSLQVTVPPLLANPEPVVEPSAAELGQDVTPVAAVQATAGTVEGSSLSGPQVAGLVTAGVGVLAIGLGTYFGLRAIAKADEADKGCSVTECRTQPALDADDNSRDAATSSNVFVFGGLAVVAAGAALYFLVPSADEARQIALSADVARDGRGAVLRISGGF